MKMKRLVALLTVAVVTVSTAGMCAFAQPEQAEVYVTITNGSLVMAHEQVAVTDIDEDGQLTISDALFAAHEAGYQGGAEAGYACEKTEYGMSLKKLWGVENGGGYGYYLNNALANSLLDTVADRDELCAFVFTDLAAFSDAYCYFDETSAAVSAGDAVRLTLTVCGFDENWNPVAAPAEGAIITIDGEDADICTDSEGAAEVTLQSSGRHVISARSDSVNLVPPVCVVEVEAAEAANENAVTPVENRGFKIWYAIAAAVALVAAIGVCAGCARKKKSA